MSGSSDPNVLKGLRLSVKDNIQVQGYSFSAGLPCFSGRIAATTAPCVERLLKAGAALGVASRADAGGFGVVSPEIQNPVFPNRIVGGSTGEGAAMVAAHRADIALGTDTGGSVRIPAACCAIFGYKPTWGRLPSHGVWPLAPALETAGFMARSFDVLQRIAEIFEPQTAQPQGLADLPSEPIIGIDPKRAREDAPAVREAMLRAVARLRFLGWRVEEVDLVSSSWSARVHSTLVLWLAREVYQKVLEDQGEAGLGPTAFRAMQAAQTISEKDFTAAHAEWAKIRAQTQALFSSVNVLLTPTLPIEPPLRGQWKVGLNGHNHSVLQLLTRETHLANLTGMPALSFPLPSHTVSLQLAAKNDADAWLFRVAMQIRSLLT